MIAKILKNFGNNFPLIEASREISSCLFLIKSSEIFDRPQIGAANKLNRLVEQSRTIIAASELDTKDKTALTKLPDECLIRFLRDLHLSVIRMDGHLMHVK